MCKQFYLAYDSLHDYTALKSEFLTSLVWGHLQSLIKALVLKDAWNISWHIRKPSIFILTAISQVKGNFRKIYVALMKVRDSQPDRMAIWRLLPEDLLLIKNELKRFLRKLGIWNTSGRCKNNYVKEKRNHSRNRKYSVSVFLYSCCETR